MDLTKLTSPRALDDMKKEELEALAQAIRAEILKTVSKNGGHLASNLGIVELTIALHRAFFCPEDMFVFDVGHQSYAHKLLTGRANIFETLRELDGMSGFPSISESVYDAFSTGHASTAISAAVGLARARDVQNEKHHVVAIVGDGAMTGGMCYEALNDAGSNKTRVIVILNDNGMSISHNVGAMSTYLTKLRTGKSWMNTKRALSTFLKKIPKIGHKTYKVFRRVKDGVRNVFIKDGVFSALGFRYLGPIDGHNIKEMERVFKRAQLLEEPVLIHVCTKKGYGYAPAENMPSTFHGTPPFRVESGEREETPSIPSFGNAASTFLSKEAEKNNKIAVVIAAMADGTGFTQFEEKHKDKIYDVGIAEEHAVTMAAGLAKGGLQPFVAIYDTFLQRAFDQIVVDVCLQNLPVVFLIDRAGITGHDGATHHGVFGFSYLTPVPNLTVLAPRCIEELNQMLAFALDKNGPVAILYPRLESKNGEQYAYNTFEMPKWEEIIQGEDCALLTVSTAVDVGLDVQKKLKAQGIKASVVNCSCVKPLDEIYIKQLFSEKKKVFTIEHQVLSGSLSSCINDYVSQNNLGHISKMFTLPDKFIAHGKTSELLKRCHLDSDEVSKQIEHIMRGENHG